MSSNGEDQMIVVTSQVDEEVKAAANSPQRQEAEKASASNDSADSKEDPAKPSNVRISKETSLRRLITYVMARVQAGSTVTIQALTLQVERAINVASIVRDRIGNVHQVNSLLIVEETAKPGEETENVNPRTTSGIQIVLSLKPLNEDEVGYQKPKPRGYAQQHFLRRRQRNLSRRKNQEGSGSTRPPAVKQQAADGGATKATKEKDKVAPNLAPADGDKPKGRRRRRAPSESQAKKNEAARPDKNSQDNKVQNEEDAKAKKGRKNSRRRRSKTTDNKENTETAKKVQNGNAPEDRPKSRAQSRQSNHRRKSVTEKDAMIDDDLDHLGRPVRRNQNHNDGRMPPHQNQARPPMNQGRAPYQYGQSHRYMMNYRQEGRDGYFKQYDQQGYRPTYYGNGRPHPGSYNNNRMGGQGHRVGYFPAASRPQNPDQLMDNFNDRPTRGMGAGRRGGYGNNSNF